MKLNLEFESGFISFITIYYYLLFGDYLSDDDHSVTMGSTFIRRFIPEMCFLHFFFLSTNKNVLKVSFFKSHALAYEESFIIMCSAYEGSI